MTYLQGGQCHGGGEGGKIQCHGGGEGGKIQCHGGGDGVACG